MGTDKTITKPAPPKELIARDFQVAQLQAVLFTPDEEVSAPKLLRSLVPKWQSLFNAEPVVLPTGVPGVPRQVPRLVLQQQGGSWRCEISSERISINWQRQAVEVPPSSFVEDSVALLNEYVAFLGARVGRMAAVAMRFAPHEKPGLFLARHFCSERWLKAPFNRPESFELHAHKTFLLGTRFNVNSWVRNRTAFAEVTGSTRELGVAVEQDLNTPFEEATTVAYSPADVGSFFALAVPEFENIMRLYYPA